MTAPERKVRKSVTLRRSIVEQIEERVGRGGFSLFIEAAAEHRLGLQPHQRQLERERLRELIRASEAANGPAEPTAVEAKRAVLRGETEVPGSG